LTTAHFSPHAPVKTRALDGRGPGASLNRIPGSLRVVTGMLHSISLFAFLFVFWLLLSGYFTAFLLAAGVGSALAVVWFARRLHVVDFEGHPIHLGPKALMYWPWLIKEIVKSAWDVSRIILNPALPISPTLVRFRPSQRTVMGLVIHAQSITLTPGTITIEAEMDEFLVHGLTRSSAQGVIDSEMDRRVTACESAT
jgi:multicomponent Na+:H+ antiporter subunit E